MTAYTGQTWTMLGQLCAALWDSQSQPVVIQLDLNQGVCNVVSTNEMQCLRPLHHSGAPIIVLSELERQPLAFLGLAL
jgi:hypothetical protein